MINDKLKNHISKDNFCDRFMINEISIWDAIKALVKGGNAVDLRKVKDRDLSAIGKRIKHDIVTLEKYFDEDCKKYGLSTDELSDLKCSGKWREWQKKWHKDHDEPMPNYGKLSKKEVKKINKKVNKAFKKSVK